MDATSVTHLCRDTDVSDGDAEVFEAHLNSGKLLSTGRTCVGVCMCVYMWVYVIRCMHRPSRRLLSVKLLQ